MCHNTTSFQDCFLFVPHCSLGQKLVTANSDKLHLDGIGTMSTAQVQYKEMNCLVCICAKCMITVIQQLTD